jgi:crossover junction endodeoxyribonuclease RuvC
MKTTKSSPVASDRIILGIDPGTTVMGYGILHVVEGRVRLTEAGAIRFVSTDDHTHKLKAIFDSTAEIIGRYAPRELAIEAQFFGKNVQSMLKLGRAQGGGDRSSVTRWPFGGGVRTHACEAEHHGQR